MTEAIETKEKRRKFLEEIKKILPESPYWNEWLESTGELPPDFDSLVSIPEPPDPLIRYNKDGLHKHIKSLEEWLEYREEIKDHFTKWVLGSTPPAPDNIEPELLCEKCEDGTTIQEIKLHFGPEKKAELWLELLIPAGKGPFPVFLTQHNHRAWALIALKRGYIGCIYAGADSKDDTDSFLAAYPGYDWSRLMRRAWAASRCIDYLYKLPQVNKNQIVLTGHSRNGKQSLFAAAYDERITVVISSSSGAGGVLPTRDWSEQHFGEGIELITRSYPEWFHPRLRFFVGREHKLPIDFHQLPAIIAPRACLLSIATNDPVESLWAMENAYLLVKKVYKLFGAEDKLRILVRPGSHETRPDTIERYIDWADHNFGRKVFNFPERLIYPHNWDEWRKNQDEKIEQKIPTPINSSTISSKEEWEKRKKEIRERVLWMLGDAPPVATNPGGDYGREPIHTATLLYRLRPSEKIRKGQIVFGEYINGDIYMLENLPEKDQKAPLVLWLGPFSVPHGYIAAYRRGDLKVYLPFIAKTLSAVFCFDYIGCGSRIEEIENFYKRHPNWSLFGKIIRDCQAALDVICSLPYIDKDRIFAVGYGMGALIGSHLAVLDERIKGFAAICLPQPFRLDTQQKPTGGLRRWSHRYMLIPRLGLFIGREDKVPYDIDMLISSICPRPVLIISPSLDREADITDITACIQRAKEVYKIYGAEEKLEHLTPLTYNHFDDNMQNLVINWLAKLAYGRPIIW